MESWPHNIWIKRFLPILILAAGWFGYTEYRSYSAGQADSRMDHHARLVAGLWVAAAVYRQNPDQYNAARDSLFTANNTDRAALDAYLTKMDSESDRSIAFSRLVEAYVDSMVAVEESLRGIRRDTADYIP